MTFLVSNIFQDMNSYSTGANFHLANLIIIVADLFPLASLQGTRHEIFPDPKFVNPGVP